MLNRLVLALVLAIVPLITLVAPGCAKEECPTLNLMEIEALLQKTPSCERAVTLFEACQFGSSGDVGMGQIVTEKCEAGFLTKLTKAQRKTYDREQKRCAQKYRKESGTMYRSFEAFCGAYVARTYSRKFVK